MPSAWRIVRAARVNSAFTGEGARVYGGRWNSRGTAVIYVSEHESLAALELFVHLTPLSPNDRYRSFRLEWEDKLTEYFPVKSLPPHWNAEPPTFQTMQIGDEWVRAGKSVALAVPSVLSTSEMNFLLNPRHPDFKRIKISQPIAVSVRFAPVESLTIRWNNGRSRRSASRRALKIEQNKTTRVEKPVSDDHGPKISPRR